MDDELPPGAWQECTTIFYASDSHPFCNCSLSHYAYRFLFNFSSDEPDDAQKALVSESVLLQCEECIMGYLEARRNLLRTLSEVYVESTITALSQLYLQWDLSRIQSGLACVQSIAQSPGIVDPKAFPSALFELFIDLDRLLPLNPLESCAELVDEILVRLSTLPTADLQQATRHLIFSQRDVLPPSLIRAWANPRVVVRKVAKDATDAIEPDDFLILNDLSICPCPTKFREILIDWSLEIGSLCSSIRVISQSQSTDAMQWMTCGDHLIHNTLSNESSSALSSAKTQVGPVERITTILSAVYQLFKSNCLPMAELHTGPINSICISILAILRLANYGTRQGKPDFSQPFVSLIECLFAVVQVFSELWNVKCPIFVTLDDTDDKDVDKDRENNTTALNAPVQSSNHSVCAITAWLSTFHQLWAAPLHSTSQLCMLQVGFVSSIALVHFVRGVLVSSSSTTSGPVSTYSVLTVVLSVTSFVHRQALMM